MSEPVEMMGLEEFQELAQQLNALPAGKAIRLYNENVPRMVLEFRIKVLEVFLIACIEKIASLEAKVGSQRVPGGGRGL